MPNNRYSAIYWQTRTSQCQIHMKEARKLLARICTASGGPDLRDASFCVLRACELPDVALAVLNRDMVAKQNDDGKMDFQ